jgi:hypothetical protein
MAPPNGTTDTISGEAIYNRTLEGALAKVPYEYYEARTAVFRKNGARTAYTVRDKKLMPIMYVNKMVEAGPTKDFARFATGWELKHSKVPFGDGQGNVDPLVDENMVVIGHYGNFDSNDVFIPRGLPNDGKVVEQPVRGVYVPGQRIVEVKKSPLSLKDMLQAEIPVFANRYDTGSYLNRGYQQWPTPQQGFTLLTDIEGQILLVLDVRDKDGITPSAFDLFDVISVGKLVLLGASAVAGRLVVRTLVRRRAAKAMAQVAKREVGAVAGREAAEVATKVEVQTAKVTQADILAWERQGGHTVQHHGPQLTREKLKERVVAQEKNIPNPANRPRIDGEKAKDFRVWRGKAAGVDAASKWESDETMRRAIGDMINKNLEQIRRTTKNGGSVVLENQRTGYKTGEGWVSTYEKKAESLMFYKEDLDGITIVIRPRVNHVPTASDPEGWYVHTAYPDVAK